MLIPVILSGGAGTRLWPVSRRLYPKPFMALPDGDTLIGKTLARALAVATPGAPVYTVPDAQERLRALLEKRAGKGVKQ